VGSLSRRGSHGTLRAIGVGRRVDRYGVASDESLSIVRLVIAFVILGIKSIGQIRVDGSPALE
jgi:hypothetical protein